MEDLYELCYSDQVHPDVSHAGTQPADTPAHVPDPSHHSQLRIPPQHPRVPDPSHRSQSQIPYGYTTSSHSDPTIAHSNTSSSSSSAFFIPQTHSTPSLVPSSRGRASSSGSSWSASSKAKHWAALNLIDLNAELLMSHERQLVRQGYKCDKMEEKSSTRKAKYEASICHNTAMVNIMGHFNQAARRRVNFVERLLQADMPIERVVATAENLTGVLSSVVLMDPTSSLSHASGSPRSSMTPSYVTKSSPPPAMTPSPASSALSFLFVPDVAFSPRPSVASPLSAAPHHSTCPRHFCFRLTRCC